MYVLMQARSFSRGLVVMRQLDLDLFLFCRDVHECTSHHVPAFLRPLFRWTGVSWFSLGSLAQLVLEKNSWE